MTAALVSTGPIGTNLYMRYRNQLLLMLAPFLLGLIVLVVLPATASLAVAFFNYTPLHPAGFTWDGLGQFSQLQADSQFWRALSNSLLYTLFSVPLRMVGILGLSLFLEKRRKGIGTVRAAAYLPTIIPDVAYALTWLWIVNPLFGPINQILRALHLPAQSWLIQPAGALGIVVGMSVWQIGEGVVITLAALRDVPQDLYDAALTDGAGWWMRLRALVLPLIAPTFLLLLFRTTIVSLQDNFAPSYILTHDNPTFLNYAIYFLPLKIYTEAFQNFRFSYAAAIIWVMYGVTALIVFFQYIATRRWSEAAYD
ncbi:MAG TPA: sugar ABC transporter permease [Chloroflexia bacterium]|nr:sugar ABC transporter permease [Chloroflexia bacterium]